MPTYPNSVEAAQQTAQSMAQKFGVYQCTQCAKAIVCAVGPGIDASVLKLRHVEGDGIVTLPLKGSLVATTGHHVGIRVGNLVYDNHFPEGVPQNVWRGEFRDIEGGELELFERPIMDFFGARFRWKEFSRFVSNRPQDDELLA